MAARKEENELRAKMKKMETQLQEEKSNLTKITYTAFYQSLDDSSVQTETGDSHG